jgi:hypothetical protein
LEGALRVIWLVPTGYQSEKNKNKNKNDVRHFQKYTLIMTWEKSSFENYPKVDILDLLDGPLSFVIK